MGAGIVILLLVIIVVVGGGAALFFGGGVGALSRHRRERGSEAAMTGEADPGDGAAGSRPRHTAPRSEQDVEFVGSETPSGDAR